MSETAHPNEKIQNSGSLCSKGNTIFCKHKRNGNSLTVVLKSISSLDDPKNINDEFTMKLDGVSDCSTILAKLLALYKQTWKTSINDNTIDNVNSYEEFGSIFFGFCTFESTSG